MNDIYAYLYKIYIKLSRKNERINKGIVYYFARLSDRNKYVYFKKYIYNKKVLILCCGDNLFLPYISNLSYKKLSLIDKDKILIKQYELKDFHVLDLEKKNKSLGKYDTIICFDGIEHIKNYNNFFYNIKINAHNKTVVIISTPNGGINNFILSQKMSDYHHKEFSTIEFCNLMKKYFSKIILYRQGIISKRKFSILTFLRFSIKKSNSNISGISNIIIGSRML